MLKVKTNIFREKESNLHIVFLFFQQAQTQLVTQPRTVTATTQTVSSVPRTWQVVINPTVTTPSLVPSAKSGQSGSTITPTAASVDAAKGTSGGGRGSKRKTPYTIMVFSIIPFIGMYKKNPMPLDIAKHKFKNFLADLKRLAEEQPPPVAQHVWNLVHDLIEGGVDPERFTRKLLRVLNCPPQSRLLPFLKRILPILAGTLKPGDIKINVVQPSPTLHIYAHGNKGVQPLLFVCFKGRSECRRPPLCLTKQIRICRVPQPPLINDEDDAKLLATVGPLLASVQDDQFIDYSESQQNTVRFVYFCR